MGILPAWAFLAWRLREEAEKYNVSTFTEYLEVKHGKSGKTLRTISSLAIVFFFFSYVGAQFLGGGKTFFILFGLKPALGGIIAERPSCQTKVNGKIPPSLTTIRRSDKA